MKRIEFHWRAVRFYGVAFFVFLADQMSKLWVVANIPPGESKPILGHLVRFTQVHNPGGPFGLPAPTALFIAVGLVAVVVFVAYGHRLASHGELLRTTLALQFGGALGNLFDRLRLGYVVDFIDLGFWPVFNLADVALTVGAGLLFLCLLRARTMTLTK